MRKTIRNFDELPSCFGVETMGEALGISRSLAYSLIKQADGVPYITIGRRIIIPKNHLVHWIEKQMEREVIAI